MKVIISKTSDTFNNQSNELYSIFAGYRKWNTQIERSLNRLGYTCERGKHIKIYKDNFLISTVPATSSDGMVGKQVLRNIRSYYERKEN